jgi:hypothetical protein
MESSQIDENLLKWMKMVKLDEILAIRKTFGDEFST